jgi:hypothetical protein
VLFQQQQSRAGKEFDSPEKIERSGYVVTSEGKTVEELRRFVLLNPIFSCLQFFVKKGLCQPHNLQIFFDILWAAALSGG